MNHLWLLALYLFALQGGSEEATSVASDVESTGTNETETDRHNKLNNNMADETWSDVNLNEDSSSLQEEMQRG